MKNNQFLRAILIMLVTVVVFGAAAFGLNFITGPIIEKNNAGAALGALKEVMPEGEAFEDITATLTIDASSGITEFYKETTGKGYVFKGEKAGYSKTVYATVGVTADGKVCGLVFDENGDFPVSEDTIGSFIGKDSALADIVLTGGATTSSNTLKAIVEAGMKVLISNNLISAGVKSDTQILTEFINVAHSGFNLADMTVIDTGLENVETAYKAGNNSGFAYIMKKGDKTLLAACNNVGSCKIFAPNYDEATGEYSIVEVTNEHADLQEIAANHSKNIAVLYDDASKTRFSAMFTLAADDITVVQNKVLNSIVSSVEFEKEAKKHYGFNSRILGYTKGQYMTVYVVIDEDGKIAKVNCNPLIIDSDYYHDYVLNNTEYLNGFNGLTSETFDGSQAEIEGHATITENVIKQAITDAFAAYEALKNGGSN